MITAGPARRAGSGHRSGWFKSSASNGSGTCVEVRFHGELVCIRDSKHRREHAHDPSPEPVITVTAGEWVGFLAELVGHAAESARKSLTVEDTPDGVLLRATGQDTELRFTHAEWRAYLAGVRAHEFDHPAPPQGPGQLDVPALA